MVNLDSAEEYNWYSTYFVSHSTAREAREMRLIQTKAEIEGNGMGLRYGGC